MRFGCAETQASELLCPGGKRHLVERLGGAGHDEGCAWPPGFFAAGFFFAVAIVLVAFAFVCGDLRLRLGLAPTPKRRAGVPAYGETSSGVPSCAYVGFRWSRSTIVGAPVAASFEPARGLRDDGSRSSRAPPSTLQANPACSSMPFANT